MPIGISIPIYIVPELSYGANNYWVAVNTNPNKVWTFGNALIPSLVPVQIKLWRGAGGHFYYLTREPRLQKLLCMQLYGVHRTLANLHKKVRIHVTFRFNHRTFTYRKEKLEKCNFTYWIYYTYCTVYIQFVKAKIDFTFLESMEKLFTSNVIFSFSGHFFLFNLE